MAPIRRYLRISKYSVLECRIYPEKPSDARWLLDSRDPVLPRVFAAIRPLVLPRLREENERLWMRKKSKPVKDVISEDDFEVGIFLRESRTRHSLLTRHKDFDNQTKKKGTVTDAGAESTLTDAEVIMDSDDEPEFDLHNVPQAGDEDNLEQGRASNRRKDAATSEAIDDDYDDGGNDDKKVGFSTRYESFDICGWVLCLLISRKSDKPQASVDLSASKQPLMEEWISTQAQPDMEEA
ncbi:uncharacterized protein N7469_004551 [Penicillium citrinum]|uniref:Uncharacterized protein n=1 Tax=Penicillium citrinum TaxID=5077 RepID=A0A9W9P4N0_PENCI|nr:uncharacterized protein N7469_004551 [Penicillium citrinum]KAJ5235383.1 hypothetical protein N7469_004551 [Penicillium citrinum]